MADTIKCRILTYALGQENLNTRHRILTSMKSNMASIFPSVVLSSLYKQKMQEQQDYESTENAPISRDILHSNAMLEYF